MAKRQHNEFVVGLFVLLAMGAGVAVLVWLGAAEVFSPVKGLATFYVKESSGDPGLEKGSLVVIAGKEMGKVIETTYQMDKGRTLYLARLNRDDVKIYSDGQAHVAAGLVGGGKLVITKRGTPEKGLADEKNPVEITGGLDRAMGDIAAAAENLKKVSETVEQQLSTEQAGSLLVKIHTILDDLKTTSANVVLIAANVYGEVDAANKASMLAKAHKTMDDINQMSADAMPKVEKALTSVVNITAKVEKYTEKDIAKLLVDLRNSTTKLVAIAADFKAVSATARDIVVLNRANLDEMIMNMKSVSLNLNAAAKEIRRNPWRLLAKPSEKEERTQNIYDAARAFAEGAEQLDDALVRLKALRQARPEGVKTDDPELLKIRKHLQATFEKFRKAEDSLWKEVAK
jgi:ABC-type transporter Mla subunit MlaD